MQPKLTIGFSTRNDQMAWMTINSLFSHHQHIMDQAELLIIDNSPEGSKYATDLANHVKTNSRIKYIRQIGPESSCLYKEAVFRQGQGKYKLCCDSHVLFRPQALNRLMDYFDKNPDSNDLIMGPCWNSAWTDHGTNQMIYQEEGYKIPLSSPGTDPSKALQIHRGVIWRGTALGVWVKDPRGTTPNGKAYEIMQQGTGAFACRAEAWAGFHPQFTGFGGNETYLMEKYRTRGDKVLCLPGFDWIHCFYRPMGNPYSPTLWEKVKNYLIGFKALGNERLLQSAIEYFRTIPNSNVDRINQAIDNKESLDFVHASSKSSQPRKVIAPQPQQRSIYDPYIEKWKAAGGDVGGAIPKPLFVALCHIPETRGDLQTGKVRPTRTLEFGCGLSTLAFDRQRTDHTAVEHDPKWIAKLQGMLTGDRTKIIHSPIKGDWYDFKPDGLYDVILLDGPPGYEGASTSRIGAAERIPSMLAPGGTIYIDDTHRQTEKQISAVICKELGVTPHRIKHGNRSFDMIQVTQQSLGPGPGRELSEMFKQFGVPACQACHSLALRMNNRGIEWCEENIDAIVDEILPRANTWLQQSGSWVDRIKAKAPDIAKRQVLKGYVQTAIDNARKKIEAS